MFFIPRQRISFPEHIHPHRRYHGVKHRFGRYPRFHRYHPYVLIDLGECGSAGKRDTHQRSAIPQPESDSTHSVSVKDQRAMKRHSKTPNCEEQAQQTNPLGENRNAISSESPASSEANDDNKPTVATTGFISARHQNANDSAEPSNIVVERTPVHLSETDDTATISLDVSGFSMDQLQVRLDEEQTPTTGVRPVLTVSGERVNSLGDKFKIHRRFMLEREKLLEDIQQLAIQANFNKEGILTIHVPKRKKEEEGKKPAESRSIPIQASPVADHDEERNDMKATQTHEVVTVDEKEDEAE